MTFEFESYLVCASVFYFVFSFNLLTTMTECVTSQKVCQLYLSTKLCIILSSLIIMFFETQQVSCLHNCYVHAMNPNTPIGLNEPFFLGCEITRNFKCILSHKALYTNDVVGVCPILPSSLKS